MPDAKPMNLSAVEVLELARDCIGDRAKQRDAENGERSMLRTIVTFNSLTGRSLTEVDGWIFMVILKLARSREGRHLSDDYIDGAAYMALAAESLEFEK